MTTYTCWYCPVCCTSANYNFQTFYFDGSMKLGMMPDYDRAGHWTNDEPSRWCENAIAEARIVPITSDEPA